jgi:hypothetical protein
LKNNLERGLEVHAATSSPHDGHVNQGWVQMVARGRCLPSAFRDCRSRQLVRSSDTHPATPAPSSSSLLRVRFVGGDPVPIFGEKQTQAPQAFESMPKFKAHGPLCSPVAADQLVGNRVEQAPSGAWPHLRHAFQEKSVHRVQAGRGWN